VTSCNLVNIHHTTWRHIPQVSVLHSRLCEILTLAVTSYDAAVYRLQPMPLAARSKA
jgi:hypothetical protein